MKTYELGKIEAKFADLVWENEPLSSSELVKLCEQNLHWKKPTTYTVLRKFCQRRIFQNVNSVVSSLISKEEFYRRQSRYFVEDSFGGSLPRFLTAFIGSKKLTEQEIAELQSLIDKHRES